MRVITALLVSFAASAFSYKLLTPGDTSDWTNTGSQTYYAFLLHNLQQQLIRLYSVTWQRVKTDPPKFNLVLVNDVTFYSQLRAYILTTRFVGYGINAHSQGHCHQC